jgi:hypothetical protein
MIDGWVVKEKDQRQADSIASEGDMEVGDKSSNLPLLLFAAVAQTCSLVVSKISPR